MSVHLALDLVTNLSSEAVAEIVAREIDIQLEKRGGTVQARDTSIYFEPTSGASQSIFVAAYGFRPTQFIYFELGKGEESLTSRQRAIRACMAILQCETGDALLAVNGELVVLLRLAGHLKLHALEGFWIESLLTLVHIPFELTVIDQALL